jgi:hypothetical protein
MELHQRLSTLRSISLSQGDQTTISSGRAVGDSHASESARHTYNIQTRYSANEIDEDLWIGVFSCAKEPVLRTLYFEEQSKKVHVIAIHSSKKVIESHRKIFRARLASSKYVNAAYLHLDFFFRSMDHMTIIVKLANYVLALLQRGERVLLVEGASSSDRCVIAAFVLVHLKGYTMKDLGDHLRFLGLSLEHSVIPSVLALREIRRSRLFAKLNRDLLSRIFSYLDT